MNHLKDVLPPTDPEKYPVEAMPSGTLARSNRLNRLCIITDAFYGETDEEGTPIIVYTLLVFPDFRSKTRVPGHSDQYYITNEYEYEVTGYLMIGPVDMSQIKINIEDEVY